jgi:hypothetical protein
VSQLEYIVLRDDNVDEVVEATGKKKEVLEEFLKQTSAYGHHVVLWKEFNTWFVIRIDKQFINDGQLAAVMQQILRRPH